MHTNSIWPIPEAGHRVNPTPVAGFRFPAPHATLKHPAPQATLRHPAPQATLKHPAPQAGHRLNP